MLNKWMTCMGILLISGSVFMFAGSLDRPETDTEDPGAFIQNRIMEMLDERAPRPRRPENPEPTGEEHQFQVRMQPFFGEANDDASLSFTITDTVPLGPDVCLLPFIDGVGQNEAMQDYLIDNPDAVVTAEDGLSRTWTIPVNVFPLEVGATSEVLAVGLSTQGAFLMNHNRTLVSLGVPGDGNSGVLVSWPKAEGKLSVETFDSEDLEIISLTAAQASGIQVTLGNQDGLDKAVYEVLVNGDVVLESGSLADFLASPMIELEVMGVNAVQVRLDASPFFNLGELSSLQVNLHNTWKSVSDDVSFQLAELGAVLAEARDTLEDDEGNPMAVQSIQLSGPPGEVITVDDPTDTVTFLEAPFSEDPVSVQLDASGFATINMMVFNELEFTGAPLVMAPVAFWFPPIFFDPELYKRCNTSMTGAAFKSGSKMRIGGKASYWASKGKFPKTGLNMRETSPHPNQAVLDRFEQIWSQYTIKAVFEDETDSGTVSSPPVDVSSCRVTTWEVMVVNGRRGGHYATWLDTSCLHDIWRNLDPPIADPDHIRIKACRDPNAPGGFPAEIDLGTLHLTTDIPGC